MWYRGTGGEGSDQPKCDEAMDRRNNISIIKRRMDAWMDEWMDGCSLALLIIVDYTIYSALMVGAH